MNAEIAAWNIVGNIAKYTADGQNRGLLVDTHFGSLGHNPETHLWIAMQDEQIKKVSRPLRKARRELIDELLAELQQPLESLGLLKPRITFMRKSHQASLFKHAQSKGLNLI